MLIHVLPPTLLHPTTSNKLVKPKFVQSCLLTCAINSMVG
ncbi:unnamed protein product [Rhodiola kirilowii]